MAHSIIIVRFNKNI